MKDGRAMRGRNDMILMSYEYVYNTIILHPLSDWIVWFEGQTFLVGHRIEYCSDAGIKKNQQW